MAEFTQDTLNHLKKLCRIDCTEEEEKDILASLSRVLEYVEQLGAVDTKGVRPCNYVLKAMLKNRMRPDVVGELLPRNEFLANAPDQIGGMVRVPPVLKAP